MSRDARLRYLVCGLPGSRWAVACVAPEGESVLSEHDDGEEAMRECERLQAEADAKERVQ